MHILSRAGEPSIVTTGAFVTTFHGLLSPAIVTQGKVMRSVVMIKEDTWELLVLLMALLILRFLKLMLCCEAFSLASDLYLQRIKVSTYCMARVSHLNKNCLCPSSMIIRDIKERQGSSGLLILCTKGEKIILKRMILGR